MCSFTGAPFFLVICYVVVIHPNVVADLLRIRDLVFNI